MQKSKIRRLISNSIADENRSGNLKNTLKTAIVQGGGDPNQVESIANFIQAYVENVPLLLEKVTEVAKKKGIANHVIPMLNAVELYFVEPQDFIPDHLGLIGLLDDAYLAQRLLQELSDNYLQQTRIPLLDCDLSPGNNIIRSLIGEPMASVLDASVMNTIQLPNMQNIIQNLMNYQEMMPISAPHPIYGNMSNKEIADSRLGAMGVI